MEYPITVKSITIKDDETLKEKRSPGDTGNCGDMVSVRPCDDEYEDKTFFGILLGKMALSISVEFNEKTGDLEIAKDFYNPAIFIPDLNTVVYGVESFWGLIESEEDLKEITDADIESQPYMKALRQIQSYEDDKEK